MNIYKTFATLYPPKTNEISMFSTPSMISALATNMPSHHAVGWPKYIHSMASYTPDTMTGESRYQSVEIALRAKPSSPLPPFDVVCLGPSNLIVVNCHMELVTCQRITIAIPYFSDDTKILIFFLVTENRFFRNCRQNALTPCCQVAQIPPQRGFTHHAPRL